jgi:hypothetical protein
MNKTLVTIGILIVVVGLAWPIRRQLPLFRR